jgi:hypothetical protein
MKKIAIIALLALLCTSVPFLPNTLALEKPQPKLIELTHTTNPGSVTLRWPALQASTIYVYRDFGPGTKPVATVLPTDTSYTDKPEPGPHTYGLLVIGKEGRVSYRTPLLPVYVPSQSENPSNTWLRLWIGKKEMWVNGKFQAISTPPDIINGATFVSVRPIIEATGGSLAWDGATKTATVTLSPHFVKLSIGKPTANVDGNDVPISKTNPNLTPLIKNGTTMLPFRFIVESLGGKVEWTAAEKRMDILFPLQPKVAITRAMSAMTMLSFGKIGPLVKLASVEELPTQLNPGTYFANNAKILTFQKDTPSVSLLADTLDPMSRKLSKTNITEWLSQLKGRLFRINYETLTNRLQNFSSVVLMDETNGSLLDVTFLMFGTEFGPEDTTFATPVSGKLDQNLANYKLGFPIANGITGQTNLANISFNTESTGKITANPPACQTCARSVGVIELQIKNTCQEDETFIGNGFIPIISQMTDFTVKFGTSTNNEFMNISLKDGCGFFPSKQCPEVTEKLADMNIELIDGRPQSANDTPTVAYKSVKGSVRLTSESAELAWSATDNSQKSKDLFKVTVEKSAKPRKISIVSNPPYNDVKKYGQFLCPTLPFSLIPKPGPGIKINVPFLNTPAGRQQGALEISTTAISSVTFPYEKPTGWFGLENPTNTITLSNTTIKGSSSFDCPCTTSRGIERGELTIDKSDVGNPKVKVSIVVNTDVAFNPPESDVKAVLFRGKQEISQIEITKNKPEITLIDIKPEPGELYMYCIKLYQNNGEIDQWCNPESVMPNPWLVTATWSDGSVSAKQTIDSSSNAKMGMIVTNDTKDEVPVNIFIKSPCSAWKVNFSNKKDTISRTLKPNERIDDLQVIVEPEKIVSPGETCIVEVNVQCGTQLKIIKFEVSIEAPSCSYKIEWSSGGTGIGSDIAPGVSKSQSFRITNKGNQKNRFSLDANVTDPDRKDTGPQWSMSLIGIAPGETFYLEAEESREFQITMKPSTDMLDNRMATSTISLRACGEESKLTWVAKCVLPECDFDFTWDKSTLRPSTTYPGDKWIQKAIITNNTAEEMLFRVDITYDGEPLLALMENYDYVVYSGESKPILVAIRTPDKARIGEAKLILTVNCGKSTKSLTLKVNIVKGATCWYTVNWFQTNENTLESDMPVDEPVYAVIKVQNRSKSAELFMVQLERSEESWISGFDEEKGLRQSFYLKPNEETLKLIIWVKAGEKTKPGDKCSLKVSVKSCQTSITLNWNILCIEKTPLDVKVKLNIDNPSWVKKDDSLKVTGVVDFIRQGAGNLRAVGYQYEWFNPDMNDLKLGTANFISSDIAVYKGLPAIGFEHRIPKLIIEKLVADNGKRIKIKVAYHFIFKDTEKVIKLEEFVLVLPPKTSSIIHPHSFSQAFALVD